MRPGSWASNHQFSFYSFVVQALAWHLEIGSVSTAPMQPKGWTTYGVIHSPACSSAQNENCWHPFVPPLRKLGNGAEYSERVLNFLFVEQDMACGGPAEPRSASMQREAWIADEMRRVFKHA
jgi:hypothetical protein